MKKILLFLLVFILIISCSANKDIISKSSTPAQVSNENPYAYHNEVIYFALTDRFYDGDPSNNRNVDKNDILAFHGGDFRGLIKKIPYLNEIGATALWITPFKQNRENDFFGRHAFHGYWIDDFYEVDSRLGTFEELTELSNELRENDIKFIIDIVLNHVHWDAPLFKENKDWFHNKGDIEDWNDRHQLETHNMGGLPDLNQTNREVYDFLLDNVKFWIRKSNCDGIRFDAVKHIYKDFWEEFLKDVKDYVYNELNRDDFIIIGEVLHGDVRVMNEYFEVGFDYLFDFPLYYTIDEVFRNNNSMWRISSRLAEDAVYPEGARLSTFVDNHDTRRFYNGRNKDALKLALSFIFTVRGIPTVYYGTEVPFQGRNDDAGRQTMVFKEEAPVKEHIAFLSQLRQENCVFSNGMQFELFVNDDIYSFMRLNENQEAVVVLNNANRSVNVNIPLYDGSASYNSSQLTDLMSSITANVNDGKLSFSIPAKSASVFLIKDQPSQNEFFANIREKEEERRKIAGTLIDYEIKVNYDQTQMGEQVYMVGNIEQIGNWDPNKALGPFNCPNWPEWYMNVQLPPNRMVEFKFIVKDNDGNVRWADGDNHVINTSDMNNTKLQFPFSK